MNENTLKRRRSSAAVTAKQRGGASVKFMLVALALVLVANAAFNYIPVAYQGENFKQEMQTAVVQGTALPPHGISPVEAMKARLVRAARENELPPAVIDVKQVGNVTTAHVRYTKEVSILPFGIYNYRYEFNHIATPTGFLMKQ